MTIIGDLNLDYARWGNPESRNERMIEKVKLEVETLDFHQIVEKMTRSWNKQVDSTIDHIWMNNLNRLIYYRNIVRTYSDHNILLMSFRTKDREPDRHEIVTRDRKGLNLTEYTARIANIDWGDFLEIQDIDKLNSIFEEKLLSVLDELAPIKVHQKKKLFRNWISDEVKEQMKNRDNLRQTAKMTGNQDDWNKYKSQRNKCVKLLSNVKTDYYRKLYDKIATEKDARNLYNLTYELMNKKSGNSPQTYISEGKVIRKPKMMANLQMCHYDNKVRNLIRKIQDSNRNPHRFLDRALGTWLNRASVPEFKFREITISETMDLI